MPTNVHMASPTQEQKYVRKYVHTYVHTCVCVCVIPACWGSEAVATPSVDWSLISPLSGSFRLQHQGERKVAAVEGKYRNEYVFILYVCYYYLYFCTEGNRFRAVYGYKSTKCSSHRQPLGVQNNCPYNLYAYSASCNIYNYIIYIHKINMSYTHTNHTCHTQAHTHARTHARMHARTHTLF